MITLGIETSCDETSAAIVEDGRRIHANVIASQVALHQRFGGVVPEIASRRHVELMIPVIEDALQTAGIGPTAIGTVAVTAGPGLVGSLLVGLSAAKALAYAWKLPLVGVNHIEGHIYANFLEHHKASPPLVCLTVSGGHTLLFHVPEYGRYEVMGRTRDDAAGEAFDKVARVLGFPYPGGPHVERLARDGDPTVISFPRAMLGRESFDFSFSGLKTAALTTLRKLHPKGNPDGSEAWVADFAAGFQDAVVDVLVTKTVAAAQAKRVETLFLSGGVAANGRLRERLGEAAFANGMRLFFPPLELCTDNAAMIASAGYFRHSRGETSPLSLNAYPAMPLGSPSCT